MRDVYISGIAATPVAKYAKAGVVDHELLAPVVMECLRDAGHTVDDIDAFVLAHPRIYTEQRYLANFLTDYLRIRPRSIVMEVMGNGLTGALTFRQAALEVASGNAEIAVAAAVSMETHIATDQHLAFVQRTLGDVAFQAPFGPTAIAMMAMEAERYFYEAGATIDDLRRIAVKNRLHASMNPRAQYRDLISVDDIAGSELIAGEFRMLDVAPRSDGAAALLVTAHPVDPDRAVRILGVGFDHLGIHQVDERPRDMLDFEPVRVAAGRALTQARLEQRDVDVTEIYSPCAIHEVLASEALGMFSRGHGAAAAAEGRTRFDGDIPISTSGGCTSRGHPPLATPLYDVVEVVEQLRGTADARQVTGAEVGMAIAEMGLYNGALCTVLGSSGR